MRVPIQLVFSSDKFPDKSVSLVGGGGGGEFIEMKIKKHEI